MRSGDGAQIFAVAASAASPAFDLTRNGYVFPAGIAALDVPVQAQVSGIVGNLQAAAISLLVTAMPGVDSVTNAQPFQNGLDQETDDAFRVRFSAFIDSRSRATPLAVGSAIRNIQQGLGYVIQENIDPSGAPRLGSFVVTVDDGSGTPSASLLAAVTAAVDAVRPVGSIFTVQPPTILLANISLSISVGPGGSHTDATVAAAAAIVGFVNGLPIGAALPLTKIAQLAYASDITITNVNELKINTIAADLTPPVTGVVRSSTVIVN